MAELKTSRPYQERFLDGFDRSQLRQEVQKVKPRRFNGLRRKYATLALGGALAFGGIGIPLKVGNMLHSANANAGGSNAASNEIERDLTTAQSIANEVAGGVRGAVSGAVNTVASAPGKVAQQVAKQAMAPVKVASAAAEQMKQQFFKKEIPFGSIIYDEAKKNGIAPELVAAVVHTESKFVPTARSHVGAQGLMQLMPKTGRWMGARDLTNPTQNITAGAKYLRYLSDRFDGDQQKAIAAYNAGEGNVRRFNGVPPFKETKNYVQRVQSFKDDLGARLDTHIADASTSRAPGL